MYQSNGRRWHGSLQELLRDIPEVTACVGRRYLRRVLVGWHFPERVSLVNPG